MTSDSSRSKPAPQNPREARALVALSLVEKIGRSRMKALIARLGSARAVMEAPEDELRQVDGVGAKIAAAVQSFDQYDRVDEQLKQAARVEAELVSYWDDRYPTRLKYIFDPPVFVWLRGSYDRQDEPSVAIVGTRSATDYGRRIARGLAAELAAMGVTVVSGLAYGIDTAAHQGALRGGGRTIAVLGSGVDRIYPPRNNELARRIMGHGGIMAEVPLGADPDAGNFPERNRIISGMTVGTVVVESPTSGGAILTAYQALEQNREVFAVPGSIFNKASKGTNELIRRGHAKLTMEVDDIVNELPYVFGGISRGEGKEPGASTSERDVDDLTEDERAIWNVLTNEPRHIDAICRDTGFAASRTLAHLLKLEFKGLVCQMAGKQFCRS